MLFYHFGFSDLLNSAGAGVRLVLLGRRVQGLPQIVQQISTTFNADRKTNQCIVNPQFGTFRVGYGSMCHERRRLGEGFDGTQTLGQSENVELLFVMVVARTKIWSEHVRKGIDAMRIKNIHITY